MKVASFALNYFEMAGQGPPFPNGVINAVLDLRLPSRKKVARQTFIFAPSDSWNTLISKFQDCVRPHQSTFIVDWKECEIRIKTSVTTTLVNAPVLQESIWLD